ncbi:MAG: hypothetical protein GF398_16995 [Chitinivibrionales bacterium]|nr:hypothetical protein [Chitinivibrionales bacterium]
MKAACILVSWFVGILVSATSAAASPLTVIESNENRFVARWSIDSLAVAGAWVNGARFSVLSFDGQDIELTDSHSYRLPAYSLMLATPPRGTATISISPLTTKTRNLPAPVLTSPASAEGAPMANAWMSQPRPVSLKGASGINVYVKPVVYQHETNRCLVLREAHIEVTFQAPKRQFQAGHIQKTPFESMLKKTFANYSQSLKWRSTVRTGLRKRQTQSSYFSARQMVHFEIGDGFSGFNEGFIAENGLLKITADDLSRYFSGTVPTKSVLLFASVKGELPEYAPHPDTMPAGVVEIPLLRVDNGLPNVVDGDDYFIAYVTGLSDWKYDVGRTGAIDDGFHYRLNRFDDYRNYWIVVDNMATGRSTGTLTRPQSADTSITAARTHRFYKRSLRLPSYSEYAGGSWKIVNVYGSDRFYWKRLDANTRTFEKTVPFPGRVPGSVVHVKYIGNDEAISFDKTLQVDAVAVDSAYSIDSWVSFSAPDTNTAKMTLTTEPLRGRYFVDVEGFRIAWQRKLSLDAAGYLEIFAPPVTGTVRYMVNNPLGHSVYLLRIDKDENAVAVFPGTVATPVIQWIDSTRAGSRYIICAESQLKTLPDNTGFFMRPTDNGVRIRNPRAAGSANYMIITHADFAAAAANLAQHKNKHGAFPNPDARVVTVDDIYREFSGGNQDPAAIRNFLTYAEYVWSGSLQYVLLFGNGSYDHKGYEGLERNFVPTFQSGSRQSQECVEDFFACIEPGDGHDANPDLFLGRLPVRTTEEATHVVAKIKDMEDPAQAEFGAWRNRVILIADDDRQGIDLDPIRFDDAHHVSSEKVEKAILTQDSSVDLQKIYLFEYPVDELYEKPEANKAISSAINNGVAHVNYFGHGADALWADEHVLSTRDLVNFNNTGKYPVMSSFSCSVGRFDKPGHECLTGTLIRLEKRGAIAGVAATRLSFASSNTSMALKFYKSIFDSAETPSLGAAYMHTMIAQKNKQYALLGDPSITFVKESHSVLLSVVNQDGIRKDTLRALEKISVNGIVAHAAAPSVPDPTFGTATQNAQVQIGLYNPPDSSERKDGYDDKIVGYTLPGIPLFIGTVPVVNGRFEKTILIPKNVTFRTPGVVLKSFAWDGFRDGSGAMTSLIFDGNIPQPFDSTGPRITIRPVYDEVARNADAAFDERIFVSLPFNLEIRAGDENGLNLIGSTPDEGLTVEIPGALAKKSISQNFQFDAESFTDGKALIKFAQDALEPGVHQLTVSAQDLLGNTTVRDFELEIMESRDLEIRHIFNYPNPMRVGQNTTFYFYTNKSDAFSYSNQSTRVSINIYTLSGRLITTLGIDDDGAANGVVWDGRDASGNLLGPNIYLYKARAENVESQFSAKDSGIKKLVIHPPK